LGVDRANEPRLATRIVPGFGRLERDGDADVPFVFLTIATVAERDVIYAFALRDARALAKEILDRTRDEAG
jgi:hypothetical protein